MPNGVFSNVAGEANRMSPRFFMSSEPAKEVTLSQIGLVANKMV